MKFCTKCGSEIIEGTLFCTSCGNDLREKPAVKSESGQAVDLDTTNPELDYDINLITTKPKSDYNTDSISTEGEREENITSKFKLSKKQKYLHLYL